MASNNSDQGILLEQVIQSDDGSSPSKRQKKGGRSTGGGASAVWDHFLKVAGENKCKYCNYTTSVERPGNLAAHLQVKHKEVYANHLAKTSAKLSSKSSTARSLSSSNSIVSTASSTIQHYDEDSDHYKNLLRTVALLFASNSLPYLLIESPDFVHLVELLDPKFKLPKRRRFTSEVEALHEKLKPILKSEIKKAGKVCLILDIWSRRSLSESYLGILIRYFDQSSLSVKQSLIALSKMEGSHTSKNIEENLKSVLLNWDISQDDISYFVTDSGSNIVKTLKECVIVFVPSIREEENEDDNEDEVFIEEGDSNMEAEEEEETVEVDLNQFDKLENEHYRIFGYAKRIPCIAHKLMCIVRKCIDGSSMLKPIIKSAKKLVKAFTQSTVNKRD